MDFAYIGEWKIAPLQSRCWPRIPSRSEIGAMTKIVTSESMPYCKLLVPSAPARTTLPIDSHPTTATTVFTTSATSCNFKAVQQLSDWTFRLCMYSQG